MEMGGALMATLMAVSPTKASHHDSSSQSPAPTCDRRRVWCFSASCSASWCRMPTLRAFLLNGTCGVGPDPGICLSFWLSADI